MQKKIIGRKEKISLPELGLSLVWAKVDTGAFTSSIHATNIREVQFPDKTVLQFVALMPGHPKYSGNRVTFENYRKKRVKNSFGQVEERFLIQLDLRLAGERVSAEFTLSDRSSMKNAILLGRKILQDRFLVDVNAINLAKAFRTKK